MTGNQKAALTRAINRFERAVDDKAFQGTIPRYESCETQSAWDAIDDEYRMARGALMACFDRYCA